MDVSSYTIKQIISWHWRYPEEKQESQRNKLNVQKLFRKVDILSPLRKWLNNFPINNIQTAHRICSLIPGQCPFAREVKLRGKTIVNIPPLCKLNPLYEEVVALRFRSLCYLEECGEDLSKYC